MAGEKVEVTVSLNTDMVESLKEWSSKYELPDISKALRVILDFVIEDGNKDEIFGKIRCSRCVGGPLGRMY
ncbi:MAG: hypothetical protein EXQ91_03450 [Alphaproteobacteria bacterium]|nr:hypothetical protein [Alphaproteobacteria bacterium]